MAGQMRPRASWRAAFLRALGEGGSVVRAAAAVGIDKTSAYAMRRRDPQFAALWATAVAQGRARLAAGAEPPVLRPDETVRASRAGKLCIMRTGPGRWSAAKERAFLEALAASANVAAAARAAGVSTVAVYNRRMRWPGFAEAWAAALEQGFARLETFLVHAASATLDPEPITGAGEAPAMTIDQAMNLYRLHRAEVRGAGERRRLGRPRADLPLEEVRAEVLRRVRAVAGA